MKTKIKKMAVLLLMMSIFTTAFSETAAPATANGINPGDVVINEIMWMGSSVSSSDEWIELKNMTEQEIDLSNCQLTKISSDVETLMLEIPSDKSIVSQGYFLISNFDKDNSNININPDLTDTAVTLSNSKLQIKLYCGGAWDNDGILIDTADDGAGAPLAGDNGDIKKSMSRKSTPGDGTSADNWCTAETSVNWDAGATEKGTPGVMNSCDEEQCDDADEDGICDNEDNCSGVFNPDQTDADSDGIGDACDNCPEIANSDQEDTDEDGIGNACESIEDTLFVAESHPTDDSIDVSISVIPYLEFSEPLDIDTIVGADNIQLRKYAALAADSTQVEVNLSLENNDKKVVFNLVEDLDYGTQYYFYVGAGVKGANGNPIESENKWLHGDRANHEFTTEISDETPSDETPPVRSDGLPTGELTAGTTEVTLSLTTDENATCKYSIIAGTEYEAMTDAFSTTGEMSHSTSITGLENGQSYAYYVRCQDELENVNVDDYEISFSVASPQSSGESGGFTPSSISSSNKPLTVLSFQKGEMTQRLNGENEVKVEIPKGSVKARTTFAASKGSLANGNAPKNKVGAFLFNGLVFNIEAVDLRGDAVRDFSEDITITLTVPNLPDDASNLELYYYNDESGKWIAISDVEFGDNTISFKVNHLTQFAVFEIPEPVVKGASDIVLFDGDVIRNPNAQGMAKFDVYVVKVINGKKFKRLILNPDVFESYGHLKWENIKLVDQSVTDSFTLSNLARFEAKVGVDSFKVYRLIQNDDIGKKQHFNMAAFEFSAKGYDWDSVYTINSVDMNVYVHGPDII
jgi:hypothetical protein